MRIVQATIDGFGKWYDETIDFSSANLTCLYGENESGKSTLYQFILFMLFGLSPKKRELFHPKTGAKMGGRLTLYDPEIGEYTVERYDAKRNGAAVCYTSDGQFKDEAWLYKRLNGMTLQTYQAIFSFSANDLAGLREMKEEDLGDVLLSIGMTGAKNIQKVEKQLDAQMAALFKPYGKKPVINEQLALLNELRTSLQQADQEEASYRERKDMIDQLETEINQLKQNLQQEKQLLSFCDKQMQALPLIQQYRFYKKQLAALPTSISFPEDGVNRFQQIKDALLPIQSEHAVIMDNLETYRANKKQLMADQVSDAVYEQACELLEQATNYLEKERDQQKLLEKKQQKEAQLTASLDQLNIGITTDDLAMLSLSFHTEDTWNKLVQNSNQIALEWEQFEQEERIAKRQQQDLLEQQETLQTQVLSGSRVEELRQTVQTYQQQTQSENQHQTGSKQWQQLKQKKEKSAKQVLIGSFFAALICLGGLWVFDRTNVWITIVVILVIGIGCWGWMKRSLRDMEQLFEHEEQAPLYVTEQAWMEAKDLLAKNERHEAELSAIKDQLKTANVQWLTLAERKNTLEVKQERLQQQIEQQYAIYPFLREVDLAYWTPLYHALRSALSVYREIKQIAEKQATIEQEMDQFAKNMQTFFQGSDGESTSKSVDENMKRLEKLVKDHQQTNERKEHLDRLIQDNVSQLETVKQRMRVYQKEQQTLYKAAVVETEEEFFQKAKTWEAINDFRTKLAVVNDQLSSFFSQDEWKKVCKASLQEQELKQEQEHHLSTIKSMETTLDTKRQALADQNAEINRLETSQQYSQLLHRFEMEREQLEEFAKKWAVLKTAKELLIETKRDYRDKYLQAVMDKTSAYFAKLTNHKYTSVAVSQGNQFIQVMSTDQIRYSVNELSKGTTDQLYVSLRIAISEVMSEQHGLPFVIDDAFVHFDALRTENMLTILETIAEKQQIILFTCKNDVKNTVRNGKVVHIENTVRISS